jgi:hypothetical protein
MFRARSGAPIYQLTNTDLEGFYRIEKEVLTDPLRMRFCRVNNYFYAVLENIVGKVETTNNRGIIDLSDNAKLQYFAIV